MTGTRSAQTAKSFPLNIVGSAKFGRYPLISIENTYNMLIADDFLIPTAGYKYQCVLKGNGRGLFASPKAQLMFGVSQSNVYKITTALTPASLFTINTQSGDVFMDEDIISDIAFCDKTNVYIYNYNTGIHYIAGTNAYATGTVSQSGNTLTLSGGGSFQNVAVGSTIYFDDGTNAVITTVSGTPFLTATVNTSATKSSQGYVITYPLDFTPNYVCFHDGRFIATSSYSNGKQIGQWRLSKVIASSTGKFSMVYFPSGAQLPQFQGAFQTKPDLPVAVVRMPGRGNVILVLGSICGEQWTDVGAAIFPYVKNTSFNLDYGCVNPSTIATLGEIVVWIGQNEKSGPVVMYTTGDDIKPISTDGINYRLAQVNFPEKSYGFAFKQDGHILYVFTFYDPTDNLTLAYDFNTQKFFTLTDENMNFFIGKHAVFFNTTYYMNSINDGNIYELSSQYTSYQYTNDLTMAKVIPRIRIPETFKTPGDIPAILNNLSFPVEQGIDAKYTGEGNNINSISIVSGGSSYTYASVVIDGDGSGAHATATITNGVITGITLVDRGINYSWAVATISGDGVGAQLSLKLNVDNYNPRVDLSMSYDGGYKFSSFVQMPMNVQGEYNCRFVYNDLGYSNKFTPQFRFSGLSRYVAGNGEMNIYV